MIRKMSVMEKAAGGDASSAADSVRAGTAAAACEIMKILSTQNSGVIHDFLAYLRRLEREET